MMIGWRKNFLAALRKREGTRLHEGKAERQADSEDALTHMVAYHLS